MDHMTVEGGKSKIWWDSLGPQEKLQIKSKGSLLENQKEPVFQMNT